MDAIERFERQQWSPAEIRKHAETFGIPIFRAHMLRFLARIGAPVRDVDLERASERSMAQYNLEGALARSVATTL
jgi:phosphoglycerate dehydrogenase-like enzyme